MPPIFVLGRSRGTARAGYWRLTDNWLELSVRFLTLAHGTRPIKGGMSRDILAAMDGAGLMVACATQEITIFQGSETTGGQA